LERWPSGLRQRFAKQPHESSQLSENQDVTNSPETDTAKSPAITLQKFPDLARIIEVWPDLSEPVKAGVLALVETAAKNKSE